MENKKVSVQSLKRLVYGFVMGASMLLPGVSGGTMAIILGAYDELIHAINSLRRDFKASGLLLLPYIIGGAAGIGLLSGPLLEAVTRWNRPMLYLFMGAILAGIPPIYERVKVSRLKYRNIAAAAIGAAIAVSIHFLPEGVFRVTGEFSLLNVALLVFAGFVLAVALVLPGISGSYVLLMLGMYSMTLAAINNLDWAYLAPLFVGCLLGVILTTRILEKEMEEHPQFTYMLIIGFMLGSFAEVFPGLPKGAEWLPCTATFAAAFAAVRVLRFFGG